MVTGSRSGNYDDGSPKAVKLSESFLSYRTPCYWVALFRFIFTRRINTDTDTDTDMDTDTAPDTFVSTHVAADINNSITCCSSKFCQLGAYQIFFFGSYWFTSVSYQTLSERCPLGATVDLSQCVVIFWSVETPKQIWFKFYLLWPLDWVLITSENNDQWR